MLHGPNLNLLGTREPLVYGAVTLEAINATLSERAGSAGAALSVFQSNVEGELVTRIQQAGRDGTEFIIINPAAFTHTSVAMRDALAAVEDPVHRSAPVQRVRPRALPPPLLLSPTWPSG